MRWAFARLEPGSGCGWILVAFGGSVPREEIVEAVCLGVEAVRPSALDEGQGAYEGLVSGLGAAEEPVAPVDADGPHGTLGRGVVDRSAAVLEEEAAGGPAVERVSEGPSAIARPC
jgi:hypothetical protein